MSKLEYEDICFIVTLLRRLDEDICFIVTLLRRLDEEEAITLFCIFEQLLRDEKIKELTKEK